jgi:chaperone required for assembly of F1-ATPase
VEVVKRFWDAVSVEPVEGGFAIGLDSRRVKTPARVDLVLPTRALAEAVALEWSAVEGDIDPRRMPLTGLANAAIDRVSADRESFADDLARYGESDLTCYRADGPDALVARQAESWDALQDWARRRYEVDFAVCRA